MAVSGAAESHELTRLDRYATITATCPEYRFLMHSTLLIDLSKLLIVLDSIDFAVFDEVPNDV
jgi:hypothetical protein